MSAYNPALSKTPKTSSSKPCSTPRRSPKLLGPKPRPRKPSSNSLLPYAVWPMTSISAAIPPQDTRSTSRERFPARYQHPVRADAFPARPARRPMGLRTRRAIPVFERGIDWRAPARIRDSSRKRPAYPTGAVVRKRSTATLPRTRSASHPFHSRPLGRAGWSISAARNAPQHCQNPRAFRVGKLQAHHPRQRRRNRPHVDFPHRMLRPARSQQKERRIHLRLIRPVAVHPFGGTGGHQLTRNILAGDVPRPQRHQKCRLRKPPARVQLFFWHDAVDAVRRIGGKFCQQLGDLRFGRRVVLVLKNDRFGASRAPNHRLPRFNL